MVDVAELLKAKGVVGAGGAGFPTYAKLKGEGIDYYIANGVECEPLLWVDKELMRLFPYEILKGLEYLKEYTGASEAVVGLKGSYRDIVEVLKRTISENQFSIKISELKDYYPGGDENLLVYEITKRVVPEGGIPKMIGAIVNNVETLLNAYYAIEEDRPVIYKYITISGQVLNPVTVKVPIGTKIGWILDELGIDYSEKVIIEGGPAMGRIVQPHSPVTKTAGGILIFGPDHPSVAGKILDISKVIRRARFSCIQCRYCTDQCPRYLLGHSLEPHKIMRSIGYLRSDKALNYALICSECGVCEIFSCPEGLSPRRINQELKKELIHRGIKFVTAKNQFQPREAREWRRIPMAKIKTRMGLMELEKPAKLCDIQYLPDEVVILTKQHIGVKAFPVVRPGDMVEEGSVIARVKEDSLGCHLHASISGSVTEVNADYIVIQRRG
jgi:Na+-translocating ferredoxin:NAD+ oxidoreductase RnfC subunit